MMLYTGMYIMILFALCLHDLLLSPNTYSTNKVLKYLKTVIC